jgi:hypothetical protein
MLSMHAIAELSAHFSASARRKPLGNDRQRNLS